MAAGGPRLSVAKTFLLIPKERTTGSITTNIEDVDNPFRRVIDQAPSIFETLRTISRINNFVSRPLAANPHTPLREMLNFIPT